MSGTQDRDTSKIEEAVNEQDNAGPEPEPSARRNPAKRDPIDDGFAGYEDDLRRAERKVAGEIDPGARAVVVAVAVLVAMVSLVLPHTGAASGIDVLTVSPDAVAERVAITSKVFVWLLLVFGIGASMLALLTRRWIIAWIALCGCAISCVAGMLAWWTRNTPGVGGVEPPHGVGIGLILGWIAALVLTFHWARVVWARSTYHLALEEERRRESAAREDAARRLTGRTITRPSDIPREDGTTGSS
ncbi:Rv2732c family membrane protein [Gordonia sp. NPDC003504]